MIKVQNLLWLAVASVYCILYYLRGPSDRAPRLLRSYITLGRDEAGPYAFGHLFLAKIENLHFLLDMIRSFLYNQH